MLSRIRASLTRTRNKISHAMRRLTGDQSTEEAVETLEEILFGADVGPLAADLLEQAEAKLGDGTLASPAELPGFLRDQLTGFLDMTDAPPIRLAESGPTVILIVGVNGVGKTTSVAKITHWLQSQGLKVLVGAADTFRAAAVEQLTIWCDRLGAELVKGQPGGDPGAVAHDALEAAIARKADVVLLDTAGRLHTQKNLMTELEKVARVASRKIEGAPHETLLVLDATTGQNAVQQARRFHETVPATGLVLAKLDGTAKGGAVFSIKKEIGLPVKFVGVGEKVEDLEVFRPQEFVDALLDMQPA